MILFAKITPKRIEATTFAFLTGAGNLSAGMKQLGGYAINKWSGINVTEQDLSGYSYLVLIGFFCGLSVLGYVWLLPTRK